MQCEQVAPESWPGERPASMGASAGAAGAAGAGCSAPLSRSSSSFFKLCDATTTEQISLLESAL